MTEAEALERWCPFSRAANKLGTESSLNRWLGKEHLPVGTKCIGSACMAWRTTSREDYETKYSQTQRPDGEGWEPVTDNPGNCAWRRKLAATKINGYCGLASNPHDHARG